MKLHQHIQVGNYILDKMEHNTLGNLEKYHINRAAYLLGNVAPDLNCVYPAHRLSSTEKRFQKRLKTIDSISIPIIKSFELGVVTHYICDYFCYAHTIESVGVPHKKYEKNLYYFYNKHIKDISIENTKLEDTWNKAKTIIFNQLIDTDDTEIQMDMEKHCEFVFEQVKLMNNIYKKNMLKADKQSNAWTANLKQIQQDTDYILFMVNNTLDIILEPFKCVLVNN